MSCVVKSLLAQNENVASAKCDFMLDSHSAFLLVKAMSQYLCQCRCNVVVLRSDIPDVKQTFHGHSDVYRKGCC